MTLAAVCLAVFLAPPPPLLNTQYFVRESARLRDLAFRPDPNFTTGLLSSTQGTDGPYLGTETRDGRTERVMARLTGPGVITRIWSVGALGTIRFYFDGEDRPRIAERMQNLLGQSEPVGAPFAFSVAVSRNFVFPIPYAKSLRITYEPDRPERANNLRYTIEHRRYPAGTPILSFEEGDFLATSEERRRFGGWLTDGSALLRNIEGHPESASQVIEAGATASMVKVNRPGAIYEVRLRIEPTSPATPEDWTDPRQRQNLLNNVYLRALFDGRETIVAPISGFFATGIDALPFSAASVQVLADGTLVNRLPMPYRETAEFSIANLNEIPVRVDLSVQRANHEEFDAELFENPESEEARAYRQGLRAQIQGRIRYLHARHIWSDAPRAGGPWRLAEASGPGLFVGLSLLSENAAQVWFGNAPYRLELDDAAIDGQRLDSFFGLPPGSPPRFTTPFIGVPRLDGPRGYGHGAFYRFMTLDAIGFRHRLRLDVRDLPADVTLGATSFWYAEPGAAKPPAEAPVRRATRPFAGAGLLGVIEGEVLAKIAEKGGASEIESNRPDASLFGVYRWRDAKPGDTLALSLSAQVGGRYDVRVRFQEGPEEGVFKLRLRNKEYGPFDLRAPQRGFRMVTFEDVELPSENFAFFIERVGPSDEPGSLGIDYVRLVRRG